jgi:hypothetical protein
MSKKWQNLTINIWTLAAPFSPNMGTNRVLHFPGSGYLVNIKTASLILCFLLNIIVFFTVKMGEFWNFGENLEMSTCNLLNLRNAIVAHHT